MADFLHGTYDILIIILIDSEYIRFSYEPLCIGILGSQGPKCRLPLEELAVVTVQRWRQFRVYEEAPIRYGFQRGGAFIRKPHAYKYFRFLKEVKR